MSRVLKRRIKQIRFSFPKSREDIEILRAVHKGETPSVDSEGDLEHRCLSAAVNVCTEFAEQIMNSVPETGAFNNMVVDMQEEYMPSYPPMSPVTTSFFNLWMSLDAPVSGKGTTFAELLLDYIEVRGVMPWLNAPLKTLAASVVLPYQVAGVDGKRHFLWDLVREREVECLCETGYTGETGEMWYVRLAPPFLEGSTIHAVMSTPYVFKSTTREEWEAFLGRRRASGGTDPNKILEYFKYGHRPGHWLEYVFQIYANHTSGAIFSEGVPDIAASRPCGDLDKGRLS